MSPYKQKENFAFFITNSPTKQTDSLKLNKVLMGKGRTRDVLEQNSSVLSTKKLGSLSIPSAPVYYPTEDEFKDPLEYVYKIRTEAEPYGICKIVPPDSWKPPFALDLGSFTFPTKTQAIHQLQARPAACDSKTFELEYSRFLEEHCAKKLKKVSFEGEELDLCKLFNAVKRFGGYDKVVKEKKWGEVFRFVRLNRKISECAKHVLCQLYYNHLYDYEKYYNKLNKVVAKVCKRGFNEDVKSEGKVEFLSSKRRRRNNNDCERVRVCDKVVKAEELDQICDQCKSGLHGEVMLLCDRCNKGWHIYCLAPPLKQIPPGNWYCQDCLNSDKDSFGFVPGKQYSLESFRRVAERAKRKWFRSRSASRVQLEKKFWEIVEGLVGEVEVMYGSDLDTSVYGSGFPRVNDPRPESVDANVWDEYCACPWNLNNLPKLKGSMLRTVHQNITGVMVPWLYIGMLFSAFCWHFEDHCFYSMNYLHWGDPKCWYSVPGSEATAFEKVMKNSLPDLFDAQPDLLFQLVTMLNPSVLQENEVPVYSVLQEPGNFVITFPRSYHAGFNFGLNCAEAVNFAPADWLPHGGSGAELYQLYRKAAVLSHEELLCVVAKSDCDSKALPYLKSELLRIYAKEKMWRELLWKKGIIKSSPMIPWKYPEYVGTVEDPTCIICRQYLYLSAVFCCCRPSAFVCLEHWKHLCECKSRKLHLLYRHTLAELNDLLLTLDRCNPEEMPGINSLKRQISSSNQMSSLSKKVKGGCITLSHLAENWLFRSSEVLNNLYSSDAFATLLKEAEQFLWAGHEMDLVRDMAKKLSEAQKWAEGIRNCLSKAEHCSYQPDCDSDKVELAYVNELLGLDTVPCNEPGHLKLKEYAEEAKLLYQEINVALSKWSKISELESLYSRACGLPICVEESKKLSQRISFAKVWTDCVRKCISSKSPALVEVEMLYKLKSEILDLQVELPETELLLDLIGQAESYRVRCSELLNGPISLKNVEVLLQELDGFIVDAPELKLLKQYHREVVSWTSRFNNIVVNIHERKDQQNVIDELNCILKDGASLRIQVDELPLVELELKKAYCREKALKACDTKMSLEFIQQMMTEAVMLHLEREKLFIDMSGILVTALCWEERAADVLARKAQMSEFDDIIRTSQDIFVVLPSLDNVQDAVSTAKSWLKKCMPFLAPTSSEAPISLLKLEALKELVSQSKILKISLEEQGMLETVLKNCEEWQHHACSLLQNAECLLGMSNIGDALSNVLTSKIQHLLSSMESIIKAGSSLGFDFHEIPKLQNACSTLQWCNKALSFCSVAPSFEDVENLMEVAEGLSTTYMPCNMWNSLIHGVRWLKRASEVVSAPCKFRRFKLSDVEPILARSQVMSVSFPVMVGELKSAIQKHKSWQEQVYKFFNLKYEQRSWSLLLQLKDFGKATAFHCPELEMVISEVDKVETWKQRCADIVGSSIGEMNTLFGSLQKLKQSLDRSLYIYNNSRGSTPNNLCTCCASDSGEWIICSICKDCYHLRCVGPTTAVGTNDAKEYICPYCQFIESGSISVNAGSLLTYKGKRSDLIKLIELLSNSEKFCVMVEERDILQEVVDKAFACKTCLTDILEFEFSYLDKDLCVISNKLTVALKVREVAGLYDDQSNRVLDLALARNSWRVKVNKLLEGSTKPTIRQIQQYLEEGLAMDIKPEDHFRQKLTELKCIGLQWADRANKVTMDSGASSLDKVFELITEVEGLPVCLERELKSLRARSMLYCICRKPDDERAMIACDQCNEWYHFDCIKLLSLPKIFICAACKPEAEELSTQQLVDDNERSNAKFLEPKTPSPKHIQPGKKQRISLTQKMLGNSNNSSTLNCSSGIDSLWWQNRKPFRRAAKKRAVMESLLPFIHTQQ
ncbi:lysine-specific demethylase 5A isoform X2 [Mangifera indica]|uniref:lysine-specific demethylase 5A isoform X2 n=1 Tax=Mangifera indica TaxID=29780 RepID=UPI001CFA02C1|nr:lysine-specific demethylase 5A isoform X2 [Mangifera indica]